MIRLDLGDGDPALAPGVLGEFLGRGIPATATLDPLAGDIRQLDAMARVLRDHPLHDGGLLDLAAMLPAPPSPDRYAQMRRAGELRDALVAALGTRAARQVVTLVDPAPRDSVDLPAFRSAGFRVLLRPEGATGADFVGRGQLRLTGGATVTLADGAAPAMDALDHILGGDHGGVLTLSLAGLGADTAPVARALAGDIADRLSAAALAGRLHLTRPRDYLLHFGPTHLTETALLLAPSGTAAGDAGLRALATLLSDHAIPFAGVAAERPDWLPPEAARIPPFPGGPPLPTGPVLVTDHAAGTDLPPVGVILRAGPEGTGLTALRADGRLHVAVEPWANFATGDWPPCESLALIITPADVATPVQRAGLISRLLDLAARGQTRVLGIDDFIDQTLAADPLWTRMWSALRRRVSDSPGPRALALSERDRLTADARVAWTFIDRFTDAATGLCAGTVFDGPGGRVNREATYWDLASQMQGIAAATQIGLIPRAEATERLSRLLDNLPHGRIGDLSLPPAMFLTSGARSVVRPGFDICDLGRFLVVLEGAVRAGLVTPDRAAALTGQWSLAAAIRDGRPQNHDGRRWIDTTLSHCTPYVAPAFGALGLPLRSPYPPLAPTADARMALMSAVAAMGSLGTEPLLLQAIENGPTPETAFLADVLFDAQLGWYETTGEPKCVSEIPLNVAPWFSYQGLRLDRTGAEGWTILSPDPDPAFSTDAFRRGIELLSAKSAYLWAAAHPHPYCSHLVGIMRDRARIAGFGFSVGVYTATLQPMENYSDLNTNGIILAAIARMLGASPLRG